MPLMIGGAWLKLMGWSVFLCAWLVATACSWWCAWAPSGSVPLGGHLAGSLRGGGRRFCKADTVGLVAGPNEEELDFTLCVLLCRSSKQL